MGTTAEKLQAILNSKAAIKQAIENNTSWSVGDKLSGYADRIEEIRSSLVKCIAGTGGGVFVDEKDLNGCQHIRPYAFAYIRIRDFTVRFPNSVHDIGMYAFANSSINYIEINNSVNTIGERVFYNCDGLSGIIFGSGVSSVDKGALEECSSLASIVFDSETPPTLDVNFGLFGVYSGGGLRIPPCMIDVPAQSVDAYKSASVWSEYAEYIQAKDT